MSSRAVRKALKRLEEQKQLQPESKAEEEVESDEEEETVSAPVNPFAMVHSSTGGA